MISMRVPLAKSEMRESCFQSDLFEQNDIQKIANCFNRFVNFLVGADLIDDSRLGRGRQQLC